MLPLPLSDKPYATCHACKGLGLTPAFTSCASCAGHGGWFVDVLLVCGRCAGKMAVEPDKTEDGARELVCVNCGARRYVTVERRRIG